MYDNKNGQLLNDHSIIGQKKGSLQRGQRPVDDGGQPAVFRNRSRPREDAKTLNRVEDEESKGPGIRIRGDFTVVLPAPDRLLDTAGQDVEVLSHESGNTLIAARHLDGAVGC